MSQERSIVQATALCATAAVPVYWEGPPGDGKTSVQVALLRHLGYEVVTLVGADLSPERVAGFPVPEPEKGVVSYVPDSALRKLASGGHGLVISEVNSLPPETLTAILETVREGRIAGEEHPVPVLMSANPENQVVVATPLGPAFANRVAKFSYEGEAAAQAWVMAEGERIAREYAQNPPKEASPRSLFDAVEKEAWRRYLTQVLHLPPAPTLEDQPALLLAQAQARRLAHEFLSRARPKREEPPADIQQAFKPYFTRRSFSLATAFLTVYLWAVEKGWQPGGDVLLLGVTSLIGEGVGVPFADFVESRRGLPSPEELLADPSLFPRREDQASAATQALVSLLKQKGDPDRGVAFAEALAKAGRKEEALRFFATLRKVFPGLKPGAQLQGILVKSATAR